MHQAESGGPGKRDNDNLQSVADACPGRRRRMLWVCVALAIIAVGTAVRDQGRGLAFYSPANLRAESQLHAQLFNYSKWLNRYFDRFQAFPATVAAATAVVDPKADADSVRLDPWGTEYRVNLAPAWFSVLSAGPDRTFFTDDDRSLRAQRSGTVMPTALTAAP